MDKNILLLGLGVAAYFYLKKKDKPLGISGCTNPEATNYDPSATTDNGGCVLSIPPPPQPLYPGPPYPGFPPTPAPPYPPLPALPILGCNNPQATNYNPSATANDGSCQFPLPPVPGCTNSNATNYNSLANTDDGSCLYTTIDCWQDCQADGSTSQMQQSTSGSCPTTHPQTAQPTGCPTTCADANANNNGGALPCVYTEVTCYDNGCPTPGTAMSVNGVCPTTHPHTTAQPCTTGNCADPLANNDGQPLPCTYTEFDCYDTTCPTPGITQSVNAVCPTTHPNTNNTCTTGTNCVDPLANNDGQPLPCTYTEFDCYDDTCPTPLIQSSVNAVCPTTHPNTTLPTCTGISCWDDCGQPAGTPAPMITEYGAQCPSTHPNTTEPNCVQGCSDPSAANYNQQAVGSSWACS